MLPTDTLLSAFYITQFRGWDSDADTCLHSFSNCSNLYISSHLLLEQWFFYLNCAAKSSRSIHETFPSAALWVGWMITPLFPSSNVSRSMDARRGVSFLPVVAGCVSTLVNSAG